MDRDAGVWRRYLNKTYADQAVQGMQSRQLVMKEVLEKCKWPEEGWDELTIQMFLQMVAGMDSNNFINRICAGEREGRIYSPLVAQHSFKLAHGIGRSGDLTEVQPKAAGSSVINQLTNRLALDALRTCGVPNTKACFVAPLATGMALTLVFLSLRHKRPKSKYIIWPRIDQKSCFKCIKTAGFEAVVVENILDGDVLRTDTKRIEELIQELGCEEILCIFSTTSSFAPRIPDDVVGISRLSDHYEVPHVINNAYGVQLSKCMHVIEEASRVGRVDAYVQSTDKNFMVPVGGSIIAGFDAHLISDISSNYPGRGSAGPSVDLLITLLSMGSAGYRCLMKKRKEHFAYLRMRLTETLSQLDERILETKANTVSLAITLDTLTNEHATMLGSMLFLRRVSGARVIVNSGDTTHIAGSSFINWSAHSDRYPHSYLTVAAAIGGSKDDVDKFIVKLLDCMRELRRKTTNGDKIR